MPQVPTPEEAIQRLQQLLARIWREGTVSVSPQAHEALREALGTISGELLKPKKPTSKPPLPTIKPKEEANGKKGGTKK